MQQIPSRRWHGFLLTRWDAEKVSRNRGLDSDYFEKNLQNPLTLLDNDAKIQLKTTAASTDKQRRRLPCEP